MNPKNQHPIISSSEYLKECLSYDKDTGILKWKKRPLKHFKNSMGCNYFNSKYAGKEAGSKRFRRGGVKNNISLEISLNGETIALTAHRAIFLMLGEKLDGGLEVDHRNGDPFDNRICNLRISDSFGNSRNRGSFKRNGKERLYPKGVRKDKCGKYMARIRINYELIYLGLFKTPEEASEAYEKEAEKAFGEFYRRK